MYRDVYKACYFSLFWTNKLRYRRICFVDLQYAWWLRVCILTYQTPHPRGLNTTNWQKSQTYYVIAILSKERQMLFKLARYNFAETPCNCSRYSPFIEFKYQISLWLILQMFIGGKGRATVNIEQPVRLAIFLYWNFR